MCTCQTEEDNEVNHKYWPKHRHIEHAPPSAEERNRNGPCAAVPKFEFWQSSYERAELFVLFRGQCGLRGISVFKAFVLREGWIEFGLEKSEEEVQEVDAQRVAD